MAGAVLAGACTSDPGASPNTTSVATDAPGTTVGTTPPPMPPDLLTSMEPLVIDTPISDPTQVEALKDLVRAQQALQRALMEPVDPDHPDFVSRFEGRALEKERARISDNRSHSRAYEAPSKFRFRIESATTQDGSSVVAVACYTFGARYYRTDTGETLDDRFYSKRVEYWLVRKADGPWQVSFEGRVDDGTYEVTECAPK